VLHLSFLKLTESIVGRCPSPAADAAITLSAVNSHHRAPRFAASEDSAMLEKRTEETADFFRRIPEASKACGPFI
jgi:hypothetical protein